MSNAQPSPSPEQASQESALARYVAQIEPRREGRRAVHIHISQLREGNRKAHHLRIAADTFGSLARAFDGQVFSLSNGDLVAICKDAKVEQIDEAVLRVRQLFNDDPLSLADNASEEHQFCTWYKLEEDFDRLKEQVAKLLQAHRGGAAANKTRTRKPMTPKLLAGLEIALAQADLGNIMRRQPIFALPKGGEPKPILHEVYVSIADLRDTLAPTVDFLSDMWLFQRLTRTLDRRMMSMMRRTDDSTISSYFSLNLNISTLLSPEFLQFDAALRAGARGTIVIEVQMIDIYSDMGAFVFARDFAKDRGYRICLDGLTYLSAPFCDREALGLDLVKLQWNNDILDDPNGSRRATIQAMIESAGPARVILCHCDSDDAIALGHDLGVSIFQGRSLDATYYSKGRAASS